MVRGTRAHGSLDGTAAIWKLRKRGNSDCANLRIRVNEAAKRSLEIDFLVTEPYPDAAMRMRVSPIEVKSGDSHGTRSLDKMRPRYQKRIGTEYVLHPKQLCVEGSRIYLPLYMAFCL